jgi:hypothetical protein
MLLPTRIRTDRIVATKQPTTPQYDLTKRRRKSRRRRSCLTSLPFTFVRELSLSPQCKDGLPLRMFMCVCVTWLGWSSKTMWVC